MELLGLDSNFQPDQVIENYSSLVWTERYNKAGDFQLVSGSISDAIAALPLESYVTLRESTVPMMVEAYKIEKKAKQGPQITISGRSFEAPALERRASVNTLPSSYAARSGWTISAAKESDAAYKAIRIVIGDVDRYQAAVLVLPAVAPAISINDAIPEIDLTLPADYSTLTTNTYDIKAGELYTTILELLTTNNRGLKSVRPTATGNQVGVEIYNGADLTDYVVFDAKFDQFDGATYLLSNQPAKNVGYVYGSNGSQQVLKTSAPEPIGLDRRVLVVDDSSDTTSSSVAVRNARGLIELYKNNAAALFDGEVAQQVADRYNQPLSQGGYALGDIIKLNGEYGLSQDVRVVEFIRSSDSSGDKAYPTLEAIS